MMLQKRALRFGSETFSSRFLSLVLDRRQGASGPTVRRAVPERRIPLVITGLISILILPGLNRG
jgi:hypothetical protein